MIKLEDRSIDDYGRVIVGHDLLYQLLLNDVEFDNILVNRSNEIDEFNSWCDKFGLINEKMKFEESINKSVEEYHNERIDEWFIPPQYKSIDVKTILLEKCKTKDQHDRVEYEWKLYEEKELIPLLKWLIYMIDVFKENDVVWGVGRGSSVSSYILYLIGVHRIDSLRWNLDPHEFLK